MSFLGSVGSAIVDPIKHVATGGFGDLLNNEQVLDFIPGIGDARAQERANATNIKLADANRQWMERMSNSAYQRGMEDMKKAGLNPILAYSQGGASTPSSSAATVDAASKTRLVDAAQGAYTGVSLAQTQHQNANTAQAQAQSSIALQSAQSAQAVAGVEKTKAETAKTIDSIKNQRVRRQLEQAQIPLAKVQESAAGLAQKGASTIDHAFDKILKNTSKPSVNPKTLQYEEPAAIKYGKKILQHAILKH